MSFKETARETRVRLRADGLVWVLAAAARTIIALGGDLMTIPGEILFDRRTQTQTRGDYWPSPQVVAKALYGDGTHYKPVNRRLLFQALSETEANPKNATFVDLGCGKGRALIVAAEFGYERIVGVEYDPGLAARARENAWSYRKHDEMQSKPHIEIIEADAAFYDPPIGPFVLFMHNPFGEQTVAAVIDRVTASWKSNPRSTSILYAFPRWEQQLQRPELVEHSRVGSEQHRNNLAVIWNFR
jgi:SAM-dependent methyltransferase